MKKIAIIISVAAVAAAVISGAVLSAMSVNAKADETYIEEVKEITLKVGKYYRVNGTENEYIEVYSDGTIQMFGFDYMSTMKQMNGENVFDGLTEEEYEFEVGFGEYLVARHSYTINPYINYIEFRDNYFDPTDDGSGLGFSYGDENTIIYDEDLGYIFVYEE